jgi:hypothetical protein
LLGGSGFRDAESNAETRRRRGRTFVKRFARLSLGFSKKLENLAAAIALHVAYYNFVLVHKTLRTTPAMAVGVTRELWTVDDLYDAITE